MDSRKDEQERGITMKSSAVSLIHEYGKNEFHLINLIDSPGHVDFASEVSSAVRLCDGAIILIDVAEGICPQTHAVLRQASIENLKLILVLNKVDRLVTELQMTPEDAYLRLNQILEQLNAIVAAQYTSLMIARSERQQESNEILSSEVQDWTNEDFDESKLYFSPLNNNVIFASALDGWGFSIKTFADIYANKLGIKRQVLEMTLWGDYYLNAKTKRIMKGAYKNVKKPLFVQLVLDNIWLIYNSLYVKRDLIMIEKICNSLNIKISPRDLKNTDAKVPLQSLFNSWLPISKAVLDMVIEYLPSPLDLTEEKVEHLICPKARQFKTLASETQNLKKDFLDCNADINKPTIVYVSKMFAIEKSSIHKTKPKAKQLSDEEIAAKREAIRQRKIDIQNGLLKMDNLTLSENKNEEEEQEGDNYEFLAFARVFSGTIKRGQELFILMPKYNPEDFIGKSFDLNTPIEDIHSVSKHVKKITIEELYLMMGRDLQLVDEVPCGNLIAIGGLQNQILKSATISSTLYCPAFTDMYMQTTPIVRVAIESKHPGQMKNLIEGLKLLNQADPCVEVMLQSNGEHILCTAGEVHLQRCIDDLVNQFAKVEVNVSKPIIPFRETIVEPPKFDLTNEKISTTIKNEGRVEMQSIDKKCSINVRAKPLPEKVVDLLEKNQNLIAILIKLNENSIKAEDELKESLKKFKDELQSAFSKSNLNWGSNVTDHLWSFGPHRNGSNILINNVQGYDRPSIWAPIEGKKAVNYIKDDNNIIFGFQLITYKGPLCEEPMQGVAFIIDNVTHEEDEEKKFENGEEENEEDQVELLEDEKKEFDDDKSVSSETQSKSQRITYGASKNQLITLTKDACKKAFEAQPQRLMIAMYKCEILVVNSDALGKVYAVLAKRNAKIIEETLKEGTLMFLIHALLPVAESFGFTEELRKKTTGMASPHLELSHFEVIDIDPNWIPSSEEELLHYGEKADFENQARKYVDEIRTRKGLFVRKKIVEHAEKQRTLAIK